MNKSLKIVFAGTPEIAKIILNNLLINGFKIDLVLTQPDRPANRGKQITMSPVKGLAISYNIEVFQPETFKNNPAAIDKIRQLQPDIMVVVAYGLILPQELLDAPRLGCVNIHVSLLPKYRGAAPIQRAIIAGETETGVTIMQMDAGMDTGATLMQEKIKIECRETSAGLHNKLASLGAKMIVDYLHSYAKYKPIPQNNKDISYAPKIEKLEAKINWAEDAVMIERKVRGFNPAPGCFTFLDNDLIKIWQADVAPEKILEQHYAPGTIIQVNNKGIMVLCGNDSALLITEIQPSGGKRQTVPQYISGHPNLLGKVLVAAP